MALRAWVPPVLAPRASTRSLAAPGTDRGPPVGFRTADRCPRDRLCTLAREAARTLRTISSIRAWALSAARFLATTSTAPASRASCALSLPPFVSEEITTTGSG